MREIEFRGRTIKGGEWKYGDLIKTNGAMGDGWAIQYYDPESGEPINNPCFQNWNLLSIKMGIWLNNQQ